MAGLWRPIAALIAATAVLSIVGCSRVSVNSPPGQAQSETAGASGGGAGATQSQPSNVVVSSDESGAVATVKAYINAKIKGEPTAKYFVGREPDWTGGWDVLAFSEGSIEEQGNGVATVRLALVVRAKSGGLQWLRIFWAHMVYTDGEWRISDMAATLTHS